MPSHILKIALDGNEANVAERVGTGQYCYRLLQYFAAQSGYDFEIYLREPPRADLPPESTHWHYHLAKPRQAWTRFALPLALWRSARADVFWNPAHYLPPFTFSPSVVTIHDLAYEYYPELFLASDLYKLRHWTRQSVRAATRVIAVSAATRDDLVKLYHADPSRIVVVPNGYDHNLFQAHHLPPVAGLARLGLAPQQYLLFVGTIQPRKNLVRLIEAFGILKAAGYPGQLVLAGRLGWQEGGTLDAIKASPWAASIRLTGYIDDATRVLLNSYASAVILPSLYEGFGITLIEAMACGTPVAASHNSSLIEVVGRGGVLFDPTQPAAIAAAITQLLAARERYVPLALAEASQYSWERTGAATLQVLRQAISARSI